MRQEQPKSIIKTADRLVSITRVFDAPREVVFKAWTDAEQLLKWHAPQGCSIKFKSIDIRPGGEFLSCITGPDGHECWCKGIYLVITEPETLVYTMGIADANGNPVRPSAIGMDPEWPSDTIVTVTFAEYEGKTKLTLNQNVSEVVAKRTGAHPSWVMMLNKLAIVAAAIMEQESLLTDAVFFHTNVH